MITHRQMSKKLPGKEHRIMDAIIGRYRVCLEEDGLLVLKHPAGICFDLTAEEALAFLDFIDIYRTSLLAIAHGPSKDTDPQLPRVLVKERTDQSDRP